MEQKIMRQLSRALQPILKNVEIDWNDLPIPNDYKNYTSFFPAIFSGDKINLYTFLESDKELWGNKIVSIRGTTGEKQFSWDVVVDPQNIIEGSHVHRLAAKAYIKKLELDTKTNKDSIIKLGTKWGIVTKYTSFIAIEERTENVSGTLKNININDEIDNSKINNERYVHDEKEIDRNKLIQSNLDEVRSTMLENLSNIEQRGEKLDRFINNDNEVQSHRLSVSNYARPNSKSSGSCAGGGGGGDEYEEPTIPTIGFNSHQNNDYSRQNNSRQNNNNNFMSESNRNPPKRSIVKNEMKEEKIEYNIEEMMDQVNDDYSENQVNQILDEIGLSLDSDLSDIVGKEDNDDNLMDRFNNLRGGSSRDIKDKDIKLETSITSKTSKNKDMYGFITLQTAYGYFELNYDFEVYVNLSKKDILDQMILEIISLEGIDDQIKTRIWVTLIALAFIEKNYSSMEDEWSLIAEKSVKYIKKSLKGTELNIQEIKERIKSILV